MNQKHFHNHKHKKIYMRTNRAITGATTTRQQHNRTKIRFQANLSINTL